MICLNQVNLEVSLNCILLQGCWRKIVVDDTLPFDENDRLLLPATTLQQEVWPMLLAKALIKVASVEYVHSDTDMYFNRRIALYVPLTFYTSPFPLTGTMGEAVPVSSGTSAWSTVWLDGCLNAYRYSKSNAVLRITDQCTLYVHIFIIV